MKKGYLYLFVFYVPFLLYEPTNRLVECGSGRRKYPKGTVYLDHQTIETLFPIALETPGAYKINFWTFVRL